MLVSLVVQLRPLRAGTLPATNGPALHAVFLKWLARANPTLAQTLHDLPSLKPYTVSGLQRSSPGLEPGKPARDVLLDPHQTYWFRITSLDAALSEILLEEVCPQLPAEVTVLERPFALERYFSQEAEHQWAGRTTYEDLLGQALAPSRGRPEKRLALLFHSPTTFKAAGHSLPLPLPLQTFKSLALRWNAYSPVPLDPAFLSFVEEEVAVSGYELQSELALTEGSNKGPKLVCFRGWCEYSVLGQAATQNSEWLQAMHLLGRFAFFAGVGYKTSQGFGQTLPLDRKP